MKNSFRHFNSSPEIIRLSAMMYVRYPLSLRQVEDMLFERGIDICHETVRFGYLLKRPVGRPPNGVRRYHANSHYRARSWTKPRRVIAKVEWHPGELYPRVGFIVTNLSRPAEQSAGRLAENTQGTVAVVNRIEANADVGSTLARAGEEFTSFYQQMVRAWPLAALAALIIVAAWLIARLVALAVRLLFAGRIESPLLLSVVARASAIPVFLLGLYSQEKTLQVACRAAA